MEVCVKIRMASTIASSIIIMLFLLACSFVSSSPALEKLNIVPNSAGQMPNLTIDNNGNIFFLHYGNDNFLYINKNKGEVIEKFKKENATGQYIWLGFPEGSPALVWRPKMSDTGFKYIYFHRLNPDTLDLDEGITINSGKDALLPISVDYEVQNIYITWPDERFGHQTCFMNKSNDGGRSFLKDDIEMTPGYSSAMCKIYAKKGKVYFVFIGINKKELAEKGDDYMGGVYFRESIDGTEWSDIIRVARFDDWSPFGIEAVFTSDGPVFFWAGPKGLMYSYRDDKMVWHSKYMEKTQNMNFNRFSVKQAPNGNIYLVGSYVKHEEQIQKPSVYFFSSTDNGKTWSEPIRINHNQFELTSSMFPDILVAEDGTIYVVWLDHRNIRGNIYMNYSRDNGRTWLPSDINLSGEPGKANDHYPFIKGHGDKIYILIPRFTDDKIADMDFYLKEINTASFKDKREESLKERVSELWKLQVEGNRSAMYDYYDPFFRARVTREAFAGAAKWPIFYYAPEVLAVFIQDNIARVMVKMEYEIKGLITPMGRKIDQERKQNITQETWLYIDNNWYRQFIDYITDSSIAKY